jgi:type I restriction enzyme, S subunit
MLWREASLTDLGTIERGRSRHRPRNDPLLFGKGVPFFQTGDVKAATLHMTAFSQEYSEYGVAQSRVWEPGTTCITIAANIAESAVLGIPGCFPDSVLGFVPAEGRLDDAYFVEYLLDVHRERLTSAARGTTQDNLSLEKLLSHSFPIPDPVTRTRVAGILRSIDELVENNCRRVVVLEKMARTIYQEWFIHFRYPGHEGIPLVESSLGLIPRGWVVSELGELLDVLESGSRPRGGIGGLKQGVPSIGAENINGVGRHDYSKERFVTRDFYGAMKRGRVQSGDVLLYKDGAYIGRTSYVGRGYPHFECAVNEHVFRLRGTAPAVPQAFLYLWLSNDETQQAIRSLNSNAAQPGISQQKLRGLQVRRPPVGVAAAFATTTEPLLSAALDLARTNRVLSNIKGLLLPRLLAGRIDVSQLDFDVLAEGTVA